MKTLAIALAFAMAAPAAMAQEQVTEIAVTVEEAETSKPVPAMSDTLAASFATICGNETIVLTDKARVACFNDAAPMPAKDGASFRNVGIGAEFNTLIRNIAAF